MIKAGAIILNREGRLLIAKSKKNPYWIFVGGRTEPGETLEQCLRREIKEELGTELAQCSFYMESPIEKASGDPQGRTIQIFAYRAEIAGEPRPSSEVEALHWLSAEDYRREAFPLGSVLHDHVIPRLIEDGLMR